MRAMFAMVALGLVAAGPAQAQVAPEYFPMPTPSDIKTVGTFGLAEGADGAIYFGAGGPLGDQPLLARLDPAVATPGAGNGITSFPTGDTVVTGFAAIRDVTYSPVSKAIWFTRSDGMVGKLQDGVVQSTVAPGNTPMWGAAPTSDGGVWVAEAGSDNNATWRGNRLARVSATVGLDESLPNLAWQTGVFDGMRYDAEPLGVASTKDGVPWFVQQDAGHGHRIATLGGANYKEYLPPCVLPPPGTCSGAPSGDSLYDVTIARDGAVWYTNQLQRSVGRLVPDGTVTEYKLSDMDPALAPAQPKGITTSPDGTLWVASFSSAYSNTGANALIQINPADLTKTIYKTGATLAPIALTTDSRGNVWFSGQSAQAKIGRLPVGGAVITEPPVGGGGTTTLPIAQPTGPQPTALTPAISVQATVSNPTVKGDTVSANQICVGPPSDPCSLVYLLQTREYITGFPGAKKSAAKLTTIGKATVTLKGGQSKKVTIKLNSKGRKLRKKLKSFKATLTVTQTVKGTKKPKQVLKKNLTFKRG